VQPPTPQELLGRLRAQPRGALLLEALAGVHGAHLVGGAVRDLLVPVDPQDLDVVVEGDALEAAGAAADRLRGVTVAHERFGTATVRAPELTFDLATARRERYVEPGALPEISPASLDADLARRDFTVNAIAMALEGPLPGALRCAPGSLEDLAGGQLRVLHDASFTDDPTRLLRLVRYAARLGFAIEPHTHDLAVRAVAGGALATVSGARIGAELMLVLDETTAPAALRLGAELGLDRALHPRLRFDAPVAADALALLPRDGRPDIVLLAGAGRGLEREELRTWLAGLQVIAAVREVVVTAFADATQLADRLQAARRPSEIAAAASQASIEAVAMAGALGAREAARVWLDELRHVGLEIDGSDLVAAGIPEGRDVGRGLQAALAARLDGKLAPGREAELVVALAAGKCR